MSIGVQFMFRCWVSTCWDFFFLMMDYVWIYFAIIVMKFLPFLFTRLFTTFSNALLFVVGGSNWLLDDLLQFAREDLFFSLLFLLIFGICYFINYSLCDNRAEYNPDQYLWEKDFTLAGRKYKRQDLEASMGIHYQNFPLWCFSIFWLCLYLWY